MVKHPVNSLSVSVLLLICFTLISPAHVQADVDPAKGALLLAKEGMPDPRFRQSAILILEHGPTGTIGLIVNKPHPITLEHAFVLPKGLDGDQPLYYGGPVSPGVTWLLFSGDRLPEGAIEIIPGVNVASAAQLVEHEKEFSEARKLRIFSGYTGWAPEQLKREIERGDWMVIPGRSADVFDDDPESLWDYLQGKRGGVLI